MKNILKNWIISKREKSLDDVIAEMEQIKKKYEMPCGLIPDKPDSRDYIWEDRPKH